MSYNLKEFNKKASNIETIVFKDGIFYPKKSSVDIDNINKKSNNITYILYTGTISDTKDIKIPINISNKKVFLYINIKIKKPVILNIFLQNTGIESKIQSNIIIHNHSSIHLNIYTENSAPKTDIIVKTKLVAYKNSFSKLYSNSKIDKKCPDTNSDISFAALCSNSAKIEFLPTQDIHSIPNKAEHSSCIYTPLKSQIVYLSNAGLTYIKIKNILKKAFLNELDLFE